MDILNLTLHTHSIYQVALPVDTCTNACFLQRYCQAILSLQKEAGSDSAIPLAIMTSGSLTPDPNSHLYANLTTNPKARTSNLTPNLHPYQAIRMIGPLHCLPRTVTLVWPLDKYRSSSRSWSQLCSTTKRISPLTKRTH